MTGDDRGPIPPDNMVQMYSGSATAGQYMAIGDSILAYLTEHARLQPHHKVLDVGCGIGLAARPLIPFLKDGGSYDGFDVMQAPIDWCREQYRAYPSFRFRHADVYNKHYNPNGPTLAKDYKFPYASGQFDLVVLTSVFTHLLPDDMKNYLREVASVMKPGARCFVTYFLLNPESTARVDRWLKEHPHDRGVPGGLGFRWEFGNCCRLYDKDVPETAVAYNENWIKERYDEQKLTIEKVQYREWCRGSLQPGWQDAILALKSQ